MLSLTTFGRWKLNKGIDSHGDDDDDGGDYRCECDSEQNHEPNMFRVFIEGKWIRPHVLVISYPPELNFKRLWSFLVVKNVVLHRISSSVEIAPTISLKIEAKNTYEVVLFVYGLHIHYSLSLAVLQSVICSFKLHIFTLYQESMTLHVHALSV